MMLNHGRKSFQLLQVMAHRIPTVSGPSLPSLWTISTVYHLWKEPSVMTIYSSGAGPDLPDEGCNVRLPGSAISSVRAWLFRSYGRLVSHKKYAADRLCGVTVVCGSDEVEAVETGCREETSSHTSCAGSNELILNKLRELGLDKDTVERLVLKHKSDPSFSSIAVKIELLLGGGFTVEQVTSLLRRRGYLNFVRASYERLAYLLETLNEFKVSPGVVLTKQPKVFTSRNEKLGIGLGFLRGLGLDEESVGSIATENPTILLKSSEALQNSVAVLQGIGMDTTDICTVIQKEPRILTMGIERSIASKVAFWKSVGASTREIYQMLCKSPSTILLRATENLEGKVLFLKKLGFKPKDILRAARNTILSRNLKRLLAQYEFLQGLGFSREEAAFLLRRQPRIFCFSHEAISERVDYLVSVLGYDVKQLLKCPVVLCSSLDKKIIPRYNALAGRKQNGTIRDYSLSTIVCMPEKKFQKRFMQDMQGKGILPET